MPLTELCVTFAFGREPIATRESFPRGAILNLQQAIERSDDARRGYPLHFMINCAHPTHFDVVLRRAGAAARSVGHRCGCR